MEITFLGATGTVTGSRYLVTAGSRRILVDCGLFQGIKRLRLRNREPFPVDPRSIDAVVLTHAHLDHSGFVPVLAREGFAGPVFCTPATRALCEVLLPDSGHLQEEEASYANRHGFSRHSPALPLYTEREAVHSLDLLRPVPYGQEVPLGNGVGFRLHPAGHILGAAMVHLRDAGTGVLFSGDLGRPDDPLLPAPAVVSDVDHLVLESTYGNRLHDPAAPEDALEEVIRRTTARGGSVLIPAFAVGRTQRVLYLLHRLRAEGRIPYVPVFLDSPMASRATRIFAASPEAHRLSPADSEAVCSVAVPVETVEDSKAVGRMRYPRIIVSASGMATGGRVLHHLKALAPDPRNTILFTGFQAVGTRGSQMLAGAESVKIHGHYVPVRADVESLDNLSAHADRDEILAWLKRFDSEPRETYLTHGEPVASDALRLRIEETLGWSCRVPEFRERVTLSAKAPTPAAPVPVPPVAV